MVYLLAVGQRYGMTIQEFGHLLHFLRIYNMNTDEGYVGEYVNR